MSRVIAAALLGLVTIFAFIAFRAATNPEQAAPPAPEANEEQVSGPEQPDPTSTISIDDLEFPVTVGCMRLADDSEVFTMRISNDGTRPSDYLVVTELSTQDARSAEVTTIIEDLLPGVVRDTVLVPDEQLDEITSCSIVAIQSERRVILGR